ncbi:MAG TPA: hypothetical protein VFM63_04370 [Pyrinomonadaceae bacterium]|nr:hypothetical protein [Pyrinomonadaceae bacterium]
MKKILLIAIVLFASSFAHGQGLVELQQAEVEKLTKNTDLLRQLVSEGLVAQVELDKAEQELTAAKSRVEETQKAEEFAKTQAAEIAKAQELAKTKSFVKPTLMPLNKTATVMRSTVGSFVVTNLSPIQQFFSKTFGKPLPTSTIGQSATHNRMGWDHRNAVDVGLHPDSAEGRALISYLQTAGIPFLAFRGAIPGVSTGPHIHIGNPSHRL